ncbi:DUF4189 domain-containing protein [Neisseria dentiae]|uniref:DUF4189 domain-containing protein n=1 Tax=Neisseria dentiae TaxID=194197 RepID=UPI0035A164B0
MKKQLVILLFSFVSLNVFAVNPTQGPLQQHPALCNYGYNPNCSNGENPAPQKIIKYTTVHVPPKYGALAFSEKAGYITGFLNASSKSEAIRGAKKRCEEGSRNTSCKVIILVKNGCVAAASGVLGKKTIVTSADADPGQAESAALNNCKAQGASNCKVYMPEGCSIP